MGLCFALMQCAKIIFVNLKNSYEWFMKDKRLILVALSNINNNNKILTQRKTSSGLIRSRGHTVTFELSVAQCRSELATTRDGSACRSWHGSDIRKRFAKLLLLVRI